MKGRASALEKMLAERIGSGVARALVGHVEAFREACAHREARALLTVPRGAIVICPTCIRVIIRDW